MIDRPVTVSFQPVWAELAYSDLLARWNPVGWLQDPLELVARAGVWMRHDVEVSIDAARRMAEFEFSVGFKAHYFVCPQSPLLRNRKQELRSLISDLRGMNHRVGFHVLHTHDRSQMGAYFKNLIEMFPGVETDLATYHAPGVPLSTLAAESEGAALFGPVAAGTVTYISDSSGRFRWGNPLEIEPTPGARVHLLTHPCWWFPSGDVEAQDLSAQEFHKFFPALLRPNDMS